MRGAKKAATGAGVLSVTLILAAVAQAVDGSPDASFGGDGVVTTPVAPQVSVIGNDTIHAIAIQPNGKIVVAGEADTDVTAGTDLDFAVARYNPDGTLDDNSDDAGFGTDGIVTTGIASGTSHSDRAHALAIQDDGKIVVAGDSHDSAGGRDTAVVRYNPDGSLDDTGGGDDFGTDGIVVTPMVAGTGTASDDFAFAVAIQADDKIVAGGFIEGPSDLDFSLVRYNEDGSLDTGFDGDGGNPGGGNGIVATDFTGSVGFDEIHAIAIQPSDQKIVATGIAEDGTTEHWAMARYNGADGTLDTGFDGQGGTGNGKFLTQFGFDADSTGIAIQGDGKIVVAGAVFSSPGKFAIARFLASNGDLDPAFDGDPGNPGGGNGKVLTQFGSAQADARGLAIAPDGKLVIAGGVGSDSGVVRYNAADGTLDTTFGGDGTVLVDMGSGDFDGANAVAVQTDTKVIAAGLVNNASVSGTDFAFARLGPAPPVTETPTPPATQTPPIATAPKKCKKGFKLKKGKCRKKKRK